MPSFTNEMPADDGAPSLDPATMSEMAEYTWLCSVRASPSDSSRPACLVSGS